jgi:dephospho-CoA kinase
VTSAGGRGQASGDPNGSRKPPGQRRRAVRIGITGPIGCGKSTIARWLGEREGVVVIDADRVARDVLDRDEPARAAVVKRFGARFLTSDGELDRSALGRHVFADPAALRDLEAIVHPAVRPRILAAIAEADAEGQSGVIIEAIKLVEGGLAEECDEVWLVTCQPRVQRARLVERRTDGDDADRRIAAQGDIEARIKSVATRTIDTSGTPEATRRVVESAMTEALKNPENA